MEPTFFYMGNLTDLNEEGKEKTEKFMSEYPNAVIGTNNRETGVRLSVLSSLPGMKINEIYFATDYSSCKTRNILDEPNCELLYTGNEKVVILNGKAEVLTDLETKKVHWQSWMSEHFKGGIEDKELCIIRFCTDSLRVII